MSNIKVGDRYKDTSNSTYHIVMRTPQRNFIANYDGYEVLLFPSSILQMKKIEKPTVTIKFSGSCRHYTYWCDEDCPLEEGDLVIYTGNSSNSIATVVGRDTKNEKPARHFQGYKVQSERIG